MLLSCESPSEQHFGGVSVTQRNTRLALSVGASPSLCLLPAGFCSRLDQLSALTSLELVLLPLDDIAWCSRRKLTRLRQLALGSAQAADVMTLTTLTALRSLTLYDVEHEGLNSCSDVTFVCQVRPVHIARRTSPALLDPSLLFVSALA